MISFAFQSKANVYLVTLLWPWPWPPWP